MGSAPGEAATCVKGINHISLSVRDLERSLEFYRSAASLELVARRRVNTDDAVERECGFKNAPAAAAILRGPNAHLELMQYDPSARADARAMPVEGPGVTHVCYQSPSPDEIHAKFMSLGAAPVSKGTAPVDLGGYGVHYAYARDADSIMFEVEQLDEPKFDGPIWIAHVALVTHDLDALVEFYENMLGTAPYRRNDIVRGRRVDAVTGMDDVCIRAAWFGVGNMVLELWQYLNPVTQRPGTPRAVEDTGYNKFAFEVADIRGEHQRLLESGVNFLTGPVVGAGGAEAYARDPDGNLFSLLELPRDSPLSIDQLQPRTW